MDLDYHLMLNDLVLTVVYGWVVLFDVVVDLIENGVLSCQSLHFHFVHFVEGNDYQHEYGDVAQHLEDNGWWVRDIKPSEYLHSLKIVTCLFLSYLVEFEAKSKFLHE